MQAAEDATLLSLRVQGAPLPVRCRRDTVAEPAYCHLPAIRFVVAHSNTTCC